MKVACVVGGPLNTSNWRELMISGEAPYFEFAYFALRGSQLFGIDIEQGRAARMIARAAGSRFGIAYEVMHRIGADEAVYCIGEDIGIPITLTTRSAGRKRPILVGIHGHYMKTRRFRLWARLMRHRPDVHLLCLSGSLRSRMIEGFGIPPERCHNAGVPVDTEFFSAAAAAPAVPEPDSRPLIVSAGVAGRDYETLIAAARQTNARFNIASGSAWQKDTTANAALPENVFMGSSGTYRKLRDLYARAQFVVVPLEDTFHASGYMVMAEAMAMGKPVIATRTQMPSDLVIPGETGLLVPPGDVEAMTAAIRTLLDAPEKAAAMGRNARLLAETQHSLSSFHSRVSQLAQDRIWAGDHAAHPAAGARAQAH